MCHDGFYRGFAAVVGLHRDDAAEDLDRSSVPVFGDVVVCCEPCVDEGAQVFTNRFASIPFGDTEAACRILYKAVKTLQKVLSSISFQKASSQSGGVVLVIVSVVIAFSRADIDQPLSQYRPSGEPPTITSEVIEREV